MVLEKSEAIQFGIGSVVCRFGCDNLDSECFDLSYIWTTTQLYV